MRKSTPPLVLRKKLATLAARGAHAEASARSQPFESAPTIERPSLSPVALESAAGRGAREGSRFANSVAALEGAEAAIATSNGMAALLCGVLVGTRSSDVVLIQADAWGGAAGRLARDLAELGRHCQAVDAYEPSKVADGLARGARFVFVQTLSDPLLREVDIAALAWHCRSYGALLCVDNTLATPVFQHPLSHGAHMVVHASSELLAGQPECTAGVLAGSAAHIAEAGPLAVRLGLGAAGPDAWQGTRGLRTLPLRVERADQTARLLAERLREHSYVRRVYHPGWGPLLSIDVGSREAAEHLLRVSPQLPVTGSIGTLETSWTLPARPEERAKQAVPPEFAEPLPPLPEGLVRLAVGLEDAEDLWTELSYGLNQLGGLFR